MNPSVHSIETKYTPLSTCIQILQQQTTGWLWEFYCNFIAFQVFIFNKSNLYWNDFLIFLSTAWYKLICKQINKQPIEDVNINNMSLFVASNVSETQIVNWMSTLNNFQVTAVSSYNPHLQHNLNNKNINLKFD